MKRRHFIKSSLLLSSASSLVLANSTFAAQPKPRGKQEYYELRAYKLKPGSDGKLLHSYLEAALLPALGRLGCNPIGVFTEIQPKDPATVFVLIPFKELDDFLGAAARLQKDKAYQSAGAEYLQTGPKNPAYDRVDSWLMKAFAGMPRIELAPYSKERKPRMFEMRTYESYSEVKAAKKVAMFNDGEIETMREVGLAPVFYGEALLGPNLPHLTYMTSGENEAVHKEHWAAFGKHPVWERLKNDPQYADTVSKATKWFLVPTAYSQI
jgi:hypothetical protein